MSGHEYSNIGNRKQESYIPVNYAIPPKEHKRPRGEDHPKSKLTKDDVREIRRRHGLGVPKSRLATDYGVSVVTIKSVLSGASWGWLQ